MFTLKASNKPTVEPAEEGEELPPPTYLTLADYVGMQPGSVGKEWVEANMHVTWEEALSFTEKEGKAVVANDNELKQRVGGYADSLAQLYFLVVQGGEIKVLYGWKVARVLGA